MQLTPAFPVEEYHFLTGTYKHNTGLMLIKGGINELPL